MSNNKTFLSFKIEQATLEELKGKGGGNFFKDSLLEALKLLEVGQKISIPFGQKSCVQGLLKHPELDEVKIITRVTPDKLFVKLIRVA